MIEELSPRILGLRLTLIVFGLFSVGTRFVISCSVGTCLSPLRFFTVLTNSMILLWMILAVLWRNDEKYHKLTGLIKGAFTTYITIVWLVFMILLEADYNPTGIDLATSIFNHYINPGLFILDTILTEKVEYQWKWSVYWLVYPLLYLAYTQIIGALTGFYPYFFVNYPELGIAGFVTWAGLLSLVFLLFGLLFIFILRKLNKN